MVYQEDDARRYYGRDGGDPYVKLTGTSQPDIQDNIRKVFLTELAGDESSSREFRGRAEAELRENSQGGVSVIDEIYSTCLNDVRCHVKASPGFDSAAVAVDVTGLQVGYLPRHTAAFYFDDFMDQGPQAMFCAIAKAVNSSTLGVRLFGTGSNSPIAVYPGDRGWTWNEGDDPYQGWWTKPGEPSRPRGRARS